MIGPEFDVLVNLCFQLIKPRLIISLNKDDESTRINSGPSTRQSTGASGKLTTTDKAKIDQLIAMLKTTLEQQAKQEQQRNSCDRQFAVFKCESVSIDPVVRITRPDCKQGIASELAEDEPSMCDELASELFGKRISVMKSIPLSRTSQYTKTSINASNLVGNKGKVIKGVMKQSPSAIVARQQLFKQKLNQMQQLQIPTSAKAAAASAVAAASRNLVKYTDVYGNSFEETDESDFDMSESEMDEMIEDNETLDDADIIDISDDDDVPDECLPYGSSSDMKTLSLLEFNVEAVLGDEEEEDETAEEANTSSRLVEDIRTDTIVQLGPGQYLCSCGKVFRSTHNVKIHERRHKGIKPFHCSWPGCLKSFVSKKELQIHLVSHTGIRRHVCNWPNCGKRFTQWSSLNDHKKNVHLGVKQFQCNVCYKKFYRRPHLKRHFIRMHTDSRPYKCNWPGCHARYPEKGELKRHIEKHQERNTSSLIQP